MPQNKIDYSKTIIYKLCCKDISITEIYVGHTTDMRRRKWEHNSSCNNEKAKNYNCNVYKFIRDNNGFENWDMIEVERYNAIDGYDATKRERFWIEELKANLNRCIPTRTIKEWIEDNKEYLKEYKKEYYFENKKEILEKDKQYRKNNFDKLKEYEKNRKNKEERLEKQKEYYEKNKIKINCECGCIIIRNSLSRHIKSKKHINLMSKLV